MKRIFRPLLAVALLLSLALGAIPAYAEEDAVASAALVGSSELSVTTENLSSVMDIKDYTGAYVAKLKITDAEGFVRLSEIVNGEVEGISGSRALLVGQTVFLAADLDLSGVTDFKPIGNQSGNLFKGTFDGQGYTVDGLRIEASGSAPAALFGYAEGTIKNLNVGSGCHFTGAKGRVAGILGSVWGNGATVENCLVQATLSGNGAVGGVVGYMSVKGTVLNCTHDGNVTSTVNEAAGGILGLGGGTISNCRNSGTVTGTYFVGGIIGRIGNGDIATVTNCVNDGTLSGNCRGAAVGQIRNTADRVNRFFNYSASVNKVSGHYAAGDEATNIIGYTDSGSEENALTKEMLGIRVQFMSGTTTASEQTNLRLVSSIDSLRYRSVGFEITVRQGDTVLAEKHRETVHTVYRQITATTQEQTIDYKPYDAFSPVSQYFSTFTIANIPNAYFDAEFICTAYAILPDGTEVRGESVTLNPAQLLTGNQEVKKNA